MTTKTVNWSAEVVDTLTARYDEGRGETIAQLAQTFGKSEAAVRGKLVNLGIYKAKEKQAVGGASSVRKIHLVAKLAELLEVEKTALESLESAKKETLELLIQKLQVTE